MRLVMRLALECTVCRRYRDEEAATGTTVEAALFGARAYAVCPCCGQESDASDIHDANYRRRVRRFLKRRQPRFDQ